MDNMADRNGGHFLIRYAQNLWSEQGKSALAGEELHSASHNRLEIPGEETVVFMSHLCTIRNKISNARGGHYTENTIDSIPNCTSL